MVTRAEQFAQSQKALQDAGVDIYKYNAAIASGASTADALKAGGWTGGTTTSSKTSTSSSASTTPKTSSSTVTETYRGVVDNPNTSGTSNMNSMSQSSAQYNSRNAQVGTGDVVDMPHQPKVSSVQQLSSFYRQSLS